jgi:uncharacterized membrane protein
MPVIGAISAVSTFGMSYLFLNIPLTGMHMLGVLVLALGTLLVAQAIPQRTIILNVIHSGIYFALHFISMKGLFLETNFDDGFFWSRISFVVYALSLLMVPAYLEKITEQTKGTSTKTGVIVILAKVLAGVAAFLMLKATDMGDVTVVQALDGLKFVFILIVSIALAPLLPESVVKKEARPGEVIRRILYVTVIAIGYFILFL